MLDVFFLAEELSTFWIYVLFRVAPRLTLVIEFLYSRFFLLVADPSTSLIRELCRVVKLSTSSRLPVVFPTWEQQWVSAEHISCGLTFFTQNSALII